jgi:hypothetical protein
MSGSLVSTFYYLFEESPLDVDNLTKPIHDAIRGLVLRDDAQIADLVVRRRPHALELRVERTTPVLSVAFDRGGEFLYVRLEPLVDPGLLP